MNHAEVKGHLADYLEGELSLDDRALVDSHLDDCGDCAREVDEMQRTIRLLRMLPEPETPPMIAANVMRRIRSGESRPNFFERIGRSFAAVLESSFVLPASAIAVASLVIAVVQNPGAFSGLDLSGENGASVAARDDSTVVMSMPFAGEIGSDRLRPQAPVARAAGEVYAPWRIQISGLSIVPTQQIEQGRGRAPRPPEIWAANAGEARPGHAPGTATGTFVSVDRIGGFDGGTRSGSRTPGLVQSGSSDQIHHSGGGDPRDEWIARGLENPIEFARFIGSQNMAEQELWVSRLSDRAEARGLMVDLVRVLRESGDSTAAWVAEDFASQMATSHEGSSSSD